MTPVMRRGFTLVELMVALMAGLIVAMGILTLSREATNTFHEEARTSAAEAALRTAMDRLRSDLQRAGYMSSGNIWVDPKTTIPPGLTLDQIYPTTANVAGILQLSSIYLNEGGSNTANGLAQSALQPTAVNPDLIQVAGNMTTSDAFDVLDVAAPGAPSGCDRISLIPDSPAMHRALGNTPTVAMAQQFANLFLPSPTATRFIVRFVDSFGCTQYLATCSGEPSGKEAVGIDSSSTPYVDVDTSTGGSPFVTAAKMSGKCGVIGSEAGVAWVNPVHIVQWELTTASGSPQDPEPPAAIAAFSEATGDAGSAGGPKYDLMRTYYDASGTAVADTREVVAEYGVDLSFAFTVDSGSLAAPSLHTYAFDDTADNGGTWAARPTKTNNLVSVGPQRIRTVRVRLATRASQADRAIDVSPTAIGAEVFMYRYCVVSSCPSPTGSALAWSRVRTMTSEVTLLNNVGNFN